MSDGAGGEGLRLGVSPLLWRAGVADQAQGTCIGTGRALEGLAQALWPPGKAWKSWKCVRLLGGGLVLSRARRRADAR